MAAVFGLATIAAGTRVMLGGDPGYNAYRPLLAFNTLMGFAYCAAAVLAWRGVRAGRTAALTILLLNLVVLAVVALPSLRPEGVAIESVRAMTFRAAVWLLLFGALVWSARRRPRA